METPLVSIIMNCHNSARFLKEAIDSVYAQTYSNWEIVFWDNASTDVSKSIAKNYDHRLKYYYTKKKTTLGEARNSALNHVSGKYLCFLDCDDLILEDKLSVQVNILEDSGASLLYGNAIIIDENGREIGETIVQDFSGNIIEKLLYRYNINMQTVMLNINVFDSPDIFIDKRLSYSPDYNLFMKICCNYNAISVNKNFAKYRKHSGALSNSLLKEVSFDGRITLDFIFDKFDKKIGCYKKAKMVAYRKLYYYDAIYYIDCDDYGSAKDCIREVCFSNVYYFLLYILLLLRVKKIIILRLLKR